jgi:hypothetical protein
MFVAGNREFQDTSSRAKQSDVELLKNSWRFTILRSNVKGCGAVDPRFDPRFDPRTPRGRQ